MNSFPDPPLHQAHFRTKFRSVSGTLIQHEFPKLGNLDINQKDKSYNYDQVQMILESSTVYNPRK